MRSRFVSLASASCVCCIACWVACWVVCCGGGGGGAAPSSKAPAPATASVALSAGATPEDRSPVEAPDGLVAQAHVAAPRAIAHGLKPAIPMNLDPRAAIADALDDGTLAQLVDVDAPIDAALVASKDQKDAFFAYAFGLEEGDVAMRIGDGYRLEPKPGGVVRLAPKKGNGTPVYHSSECWIFPAIGASSHRLVCADESKAIVAVGPWLARGAPKRSWPDALAAAELDIRPLRASFGEDMIKLRDEASAELPRLGSIGKPALDKVTAKLGKQLIDELFDLSGDVDTVDLSLLRKPSAFQLTTSINFGRSASWLARAMLASSEGTGGAPPMLAKAPADGVRTALYSHPGPTSEALLQPWQSAILQLVEATAVDYGWAKKDEDAALELVRAMFPRVADGFSFGGGDSSAWGEGPSEEWKKGRKWLWQKLARPDWTIGEVEREAKSTRDYVKAFANVVTSASFAETVKKMTSGEYVWRATSKTSTPKDLKDATAQTFDFTLATTAAAVATSAEPVDTTGKPKTAKSKPTPKPKETTLLHMTGEAIVVAAGSRSWTAWGWNVAEKTLVDRLRHAIAGDSTSTLSQRAAFDFLSAPNASTGAWSDLSETASSFGSKSAASAGPSDADTMAWRVTAQKSTNGGTATIEMLLRDEALGIGKKAADELDLPF